MRGANDIPDAAWFGQLTSILARHGLQRGQIREAVGEGVNGRTRGQIGDALIAWLGNR